MGRTLTVNRFAGTGGETIQLRHDWPHEVFVQGGHSGVVFGETKSYSTAYFEAFPRGKDATFIRGEGPDLGAAEDAAWVQYERTRACMHGGGFDRRGYLNGGAFCRGCGMFKSQVFDAIPCEAFTQKARGAVALFEAMGLQRDPATCAACGFTGPEHDASLKGQPKEAEHDG